MRPNNLDAKTVKAAAEGRWSIVYSRLAQGRLDEAITNAGRHVPCPVHGHSVDGFRMFADWEQTGGGICNTCGAKADGYAILQWLMGWTFPETVSAVAEALGIISGSYEPLPDRRPVLPAASKRRSDQQSDAEKRARLTQVWKEGLPLTHPAVVPLDLYFQRRRLDLGIIRKEPAFRFHPRLPFYDEVKEWDKNTLCWRKYSRHMGDFPALLSLVFDKDRRPVTIHRTFITPDGFAAPGKNKKVMAVPSDRKASGGAILWGKRSRNADVAEGIENALSVTMATSRTCLPLVSSTWMLSWEVPEGIDQVTIWGDVDENGAGQKYGKQLQTNIWEQGRPAQALFPQMQIPDGKAGVDWNDVWVHQGRNGFPVGRAVA